MSRAPYGSWRSPITASVVASGGVSLSGIAANDAGTWWLEGRPLEGGRNVLARDGVDVTPDGFNVRTRVHEYGGGAFVLRGSRVVFANFADQRLYEQFPGSAPQALTPEGSFRYADLRFTPDGSGLVCVRERHDGADVQNELVLVEQGGVHALASGRDFFAAPRISPDGRSLAWICWDHPQMPWDGTELWIAYLRAGQLEKPRLVAGSRRESVIQPEWSQDGRLHYLSDRTGWWNLYDERGRALAPMDAEVGGPVWGLDSSWYAFLDPARIAFISRSRGTDRLCVLERGAVRDVAVSSTSLASLRAHDGRLFAIAASAREPAAVVSIDPVGGGVAVLKRSRADEIDARFLSAPEPVEFPTDGGRTAHGLFYPPANGDFDAPADERPPLLVFSHGGPTGAASSALNLGIQFFTSRGFAVVDVNYGGSTGYGREYRDRLRGGWGVVDVADCVNAARWLAAEGRVDGRRMAIRGGSAGGYTTLAALVFSDVFACGASYFGVADAEALARDTHKFESRYLDGLIGPYPERADLYRERSPIGHVDKLERPVIFFQGLEDEIVPPNQAEMMVQALDAKGIPHAYLAFEGEQHGFRKADTQIRTLEAELYFYSRVLGFDLADPVEPVDIKHL